MGIEEVMAVRGVEEPRASRARNGGCVGGKNEKGSRPSVRRLHSRLARVVGCMQRLCPQLARPAVVRCGDDQAGVARRNPKRVLCLRDGVWS